MRKSFIYSIIALATVSTFISCDKDDESYMPGPNAMVTLKTNPSDGRFYMQLDDKTTLLPENVTERPYNKEVRAFVNYTEIAGDAGEYTRMVHLNWADSIRTKSMAESFPEPGKNHEVYGNNPVEISKDWWPTVAEDGYLTLVIKTLFGNGYPHEVNLVRGENPKEVVLCHDAKGDLNGYWGSSAVAFRLDDLGDLGTEEVELTLKWESFDGPRQTKFKYLPREFEE